MIVRIYNCFFLIRKHNVINAYLSFAIRLSLTSIKLLKKLKYLKLKIFLASTKTKRLFAVVNMDHRLSQLCRAKELISELYDQTVLNKENQIKTFLRKSREEN